MRKNMKNVGKISFSDLEKQFYTAAGCEEPSTSSAEANR